MNILYIDHYFGSPSMGMEFRPYYFAREWMKTGHNVLCVCASYSHLRSMQPSKLGQCNIDGLDFLVLRTRKYDGNGVSRVLNMMDFIFGLCTKARRDIMTFQPDIVIASSTYTWDNWVVGYYARECKAKHVYELHDVWPLSPMELGGMSKRHPFIWLLQKAEDYACHKADKVVSMLPCAEEHLKERGLAEGKFVYVPNGVLPEEWSGAMISRTRQHNNIFTVGYLGGHALSNALDTLCDAARELPNINFVLVGKGVEKARLVEKCKGLNNVEFRDPVPKAQVPFVLSSFDCLYIGWKKSPLYRFGISPNKLYDYMMSATPIVHAVEAGNDHVAEANCGISCEPENVDALVGAIKSMKDKSSDERNEMGQRGRRYVMEHNLIPDLARRFLEAI